MLVWLRWLKYGSECGCRLSCWQMPGVGHHRGAGARLDRSSRRAVAARAVELGAVEGVRPAELVAHLVRHVVDGVEVALRSGETGAAVRLVVGADALLRHAAAVDAQAEVADVVVVGADELAEHDPVGVQAAAGAAGQLGGREASLAAARAVGAGGLGRGVEVQLVGVVDQHQSDREVVVVDLVDPVDQRDLLGQHVGGAEVGRVARVGGQRQPVGAQLDRVSRASRRRPGRRRPGHRPRAAPARRGRARAPTGRRPCRRGTGCRRRCRRGR